MTPQRPLGPVVVTGIGAVSALGWGIERLRSGLDAGTTAIGPFARFDHERYRTHIAAQVPPPDPGIRALIPEWPRLSLADRYAVAAAREAVTMSGHSLDLSALTAGVFFGSSTGGMWESELYYEAFRYNAFAEGPRRLLHSQQVQRPGEAVGRHLRTTGPVETVSSSCASSTIALGAALDALRDGEVDVAIAGGADSLCRLTFGGFNALQSVDSRPCRPFQSDRRGLSLGEGGAVLVMETLASARARGATPLAELCGAGASSDAHHMTAPDPEGRGAALAVVRALRDAGREAASVDFINAHATGTPLNDAAEYAGLARVFGSRAAAIPMVATKASIGHLLGSAGAIEAVATILALRHQAWQPTPVGGPIEAGSPARLTPTAVAADLAVAASLNLGFGGCNGAIILARCDEPAGRGR